MNKRFVLWIAPGIVAFTLTVVGCQKKEEPVPATSPAPATAPASNPPGGAGAVATELTGSDLGPRNSPTTEGSKAPDKQEAGKTTF